MALDWGKQITFTGLKKRAAKPKAMYPEKTYMNLAVVDKKTVDVRRTAPVALILIVLVALFIKFGIFDFYARVGAKQAELNVQQQALSTLVAQLGDYDAVAEEYEGYESLSISTDGLVVNALDALALVDRFVAPSAHVSALALSGDTLTLDLKDISLDGVGKLTSTLYSQDIVANVSVATAATQKDSNDDVTTTMTIKLQPVVADA